MKPLAGVATMRISLKEIPRCVNAERTSQPPLGALPGIPLLWLFSAHSSPLLPELGQKPARALKGEGWSFQLGIYVITAWRENRRSLNSRSKLHCNLLICTQSLRKGQLNSVDGTLQPCRQEQSSEQRRDGNSSTRSASLSAFGQDGRSVQPRCEASGAACSAPQDRSGGETEQFADPGKRAPQQPLPRRSCPPAQPRATCRSGCRYQRCSKPASRPGEKSARKLQIPPSSFSSREGLSRGYSMPPLTAAAARPAAAAATSTSSCRRHCPATPHGAAAAILVVGSARPGEGGVATPIGPGREREALPRAAGDGKVSGGGRVRRYR